jgi:phage N-6-adenine-methyltransferase
MKQEHTPWAVIHSSERDDWRTPPELFAALSREFGFTFDAAASEANHLCPQYCSAKPAWDGVVYDGLEADWLALSRLVPAPKSGWFLRDGGWVWCNPPYGRQIGDWIDKAIVEAERGTRIVMLVFASTDTQWFARAWNSASEVRFIQGRIRFLDHEGQPRNAAPKGSCLLVFDGQTPQTPGAPLVSLKKL